MFDFQFSLSNFLNTLIIYADALGFATFLYFPKWHWGSYLPPLRYFYFHDKAVIFDTWNRNINVLRIILAFIIYCFPWMWYFLSVILIFSFSCVLGFAFVWVFLFLVRSSFLSPIHWMHIWHLYGPGPLKFVDSDFLSLLKSYVWVTGFLH